MKRKLLLFSSVLCFKGYQQSILIDMQRYVYKTIPNTLFDFIIECSESEYNTILQKYNSQRNIVEEYERFLIINEFAFFANMEHDFPKLELNWDIPTNVSNSIIDINNNSEFNVKKAIAQLDKNNCFHLQIRFFYDVQISYLFDLLDFLMNFSFRTIDIVIGHNSILNIEDFIDSLEQYKTVHEIIIYNADYEDNKESKNGFISYKLIKYNIISNEDCGKIEKKYFSPNIMAISESQCHNTCLNRKISVDDKGEIKNCPSMKHSFGHVDNTNISDIIKLKDFRKWWFIKKDDIDVCKDCEFRHICTDCRVFIEDAVDLYSQPAKCTYNPYLALWKGDSGWIDTEEWRKRNPNWIDISKHNRASFKKAQCI